MVLPALDGGYKEHKAGWYDFRSELIQGAIAGQKFIKGRAVSGDCNIWFRQPQRGDVALEIFRCMLRNAKVMVNVSRRPPHELLKNTGCALVASFTRIYRDQIMDQQHKSG